MPVLRITSIYEQRKRRNAAELAEARRELKRAKESLVVRFGKMAAAAIRRQAQRGRGPAILSEEGAVAAGTLRELSSKMAAVRKRIRRPDCWFRERPGVFSVLEPAGLAWDVVHGKCSPEGRLPIARVLWLLKALQESGPETEHDSCHLSEKWRRRLEGRRRRLLVLLRTAALLEEEVEWKPCL